jgi:hypothetical protein
MKLNFYPLKYSYFIVTNMNIQNPALRTIMITIPNTHIIR